MHDELADAADLREACSYTIERGPLTRLPCGTAASNSTPIVLVDVLEKAPGSVLLLHGSAQMI
jgi:hypothetical protein